MSNDIGQDRRSHLPKRGNASQCRSRADADRLPVFTKKAQHRIDARRPVGLPVTSHPIRS